MPHGLAIRPGPGVLPRSQQPSSLDITSHILSPYRTHSGNSDTLSSPGSSSRAVFGSSRKVSADLSSFARAEAKRALQASRLERAKRQMVEESEAMLSALERCQGEVGAMREAVEAVVSSTARLDSRCYRGQLTTRSFT